MRRPPWMTLALAVVLAMGCGGNAPDPAPQPSSGKGDGGTVTDAGVPSALASLSINPPELALPLGVKGTVRVSGRLEGGEQAMLGSEVEWTSSPPGIVTLTPLGDSVEVTALAPGKAEVVARAGTVRALPAVVMVSAPLRREVRAVWVTRFSFSTAAQVKAIIDHAADAGFNVVYFQIRGSGDAYYHSERVPWAKRLSGTLGKDPGWDPLQTAIDEAHLRGIQLHAYWNAFAAWPVPANCSTTVGGCNCQPEQGHSDSCMLPEGVPAGMPNHLLRAHPEYLAVDGNGRSVDTEYYWFSPGNPAVRDHLVAEATDLLSHYDVDGLHLDRIRYPGPSYSHDPASVTAYNALPVAGRPAYADWQRAQVTEVVSRIYAAVQAQRPKAVLSAAVWGVYKPLPGCSTSNGFGNYYQDSLGWMKAGAIDAIAPMMYWDIGSGCTDWSKLLDGFIAGAHGRQVVAGMHALDGLPVPQPSKLAARIAYARKEGAAGEAIFASAYLDSPPAGADAGTQTWDTFRADGGPYVEPAMPPPVTWR